MKLYILFITFLAIIFTSVNATGKLGNNNSLPDTEINNNVDCGKIISEYYDCLPCFKPSKDLKELDKCCETVNSEKCSKLFKKKVNEHEVCKNDSQKQAVVIDAFVSIMELSCAKDEQGNFCQLSKSNFHDSEITKAVVTDTCRSKKCREKTVQRLPELIQVEKDLGMKFDLISKDYKNYDEIVAALNEDQCKALAQDSSDAFSIFSNSIRIGSSLLVGITALFNYLL